MAPIEHAVVLGGSMAGMLAAAALARQARTVTIVERDELTDQPNSRKGTPQDRHTHALLDGGRMAIENLLPGVLDDLESEGALRVDFGRDVLWFHSGNWKVRCPTKYQMYPLTRPRLEALVRRRIRRLPNVKWMTGTRAIEPVVEHRRIRGIRLQRRDEPQHVESCDILIDATGRGSKTPSWLEPLGAGRLTTHKVKFDLGYATREYHRAEAWPEFPTAMIYGRRPDHLRHGVYSAVEGNRWVVTLIGYGGDLPPRDPAGFAAFARSLVRPQVYDLIARSKPISEVSTHAFPYQRWHRYDRVRLPEGFGVVGDALCSFDPVFGQGMSIAALEADLLARSIEQRGGFRARTFARDCAKMVRSPWTITSIEAFRYPTTVGSRPLGISIVHRLLDRVYERSAHDPEIHRAFLDVMQLHSEPSSLFKPRLLWKLFGSEAPRPALSPACSNSSIQLSIGSI